MTGLSGSGKSTTARAVRGVLVEIGYSALVLDGDEIRAAAARTIGLSKAERVRHVLEVAHRARTIVEDGTIVIAR